MNKIRIIIKPQELCIGKRYMYKIEDILFRGFCVQISNDEGYFEREDGIKLHDDITFRLSDKEDYYLVEYNEEIFNRYNKLLKKTRKRT